MKMMKTGYFKFGWKLLTYKSLLLPGTILVFGLFFLIGAVGHGVDVYESQVQEISIFIVAENNEKDLALVDKIEGISDITQYAKAEVTVSYEEYSGDVIIYGMEEDYIEQQFKEDLVFSVKGGMPYVVLQAEVLSGMKNRKGKKMQIDGKEAFLLESVRIGEENHTEARIVGIIGEMKENEPEKLERAPYIYTKISSFRDLVEIPEEELESGLYLVIIQKRAYIDKVLQELGKLDILVEIPEDLQKEIQVLDVNLIETRYKFGISFILILSAIMIYKYQHKIWENKHRDFIKYVTNIDRTGVGLRYIYHVKSVIFFFLCIVAGVVMACLVRQ